MNEIARIRDLLKRSLEGEAWHGEPVRGLLAAVTPEQAAQRPIPQAHSLLELVLHMGAWQDLVHKRLAGALLPDLEKEQDWPRAPSGNRGSWQAAVEELERGYSALYKKLAVFPEERLDDSVPGMNFSFYVMLHGLIQHNLYHAGQIALLRRALDAQAGH